MTKDTRWIALMSSSGIAGDGDHIGKIAGLELPDLPFPAEQLRAIDQVGLQHLEAGMPSLHHQHKLPRLRAMGERPDIRANRKRNPGRQLPLKLADVKSNIARSRAALAARPRDRQNIPRW